MIIMRMLLMALNSDNVYSFDCDEITFVVYVVVCCIDVLILIVSCEFYYCIL